MPDSLFWFARAQASKVSFPGSPRAHTPGHDQAVTKVGFLANQLREHESWRNTANWILACWRTMFTLPSKGLRETTPWGIFLV